MRMVDAQQALGFMQHQAAYIEPQVYQIKYPGIQYPSLIPVDTSAPEWAKTVTYYSADKVGQAQWFHHMADDMAQADVNRAQHETSVEMAGIGYGYTLEEISFSMLVPGSNLTTDRASAARLAYEKFVDNVLLRGDTAKNFSGLLNYPGVTAVQAPNDGTGPSRYFSTKTPAFIIRDINSALIGVHSDTLTVEMADTILLPVGVLQYLAYTQNSTASDVSILQYLMTANIYTLETGQPLMIRGVRGLGTAGTGGEGRMVAYRRAPEVLKAHIPMPHKFLPVWQTGPLKFDIPGIFRLGGLDVRLPKAVRYLDNIAAAAL